MYIRKKEVMKAQSHSPLNVTDHCLTWLQHFEKYPSTFYVFPCLYILECLRVFFIILFFWYFSQFLYVIFLKTNTRNDWYFHFDVYQGHISKVRCGMVIEISRQMWEIKCPRSGLLFWDLSWFSFASKNWDQTCNICENYDNIWTVLACACLGLLSADCVTLLSLVS